MSNIYKLVKFEEGYRRKPYHCSEGYPTIGFGFKIGTKNTPLEYYTFTCSEHLAEAWLNEIISELSADISSSFFAETFSKINDARQAIVLSMCYQLGYTGFMAFQKAIRAMIDGDFDTAAKEMIDSRWYKQTPQRALRHAEQMRTGEWCEEYK